MNMRPVLFALLTISCLGISCLFDSDSNDTGEKDAGTYLLTPEITRVAVYPNGGALITLTFEPGESFVGDVNLEFQGPSFLAGSFFDKKLTSEDLYSDLLLRVDYLAPVGIDSCGIISTFAGQADTMRITVDIEAGEFLKDYTYTPDAEVLEWFEEKNPSWGTLRTETWYGYHYYPEILLGGSEWICISNRWVLREEISGIPPASWYSIRRREERESLMYALAVKDTIIQVELTTFPTNMAEREKYLSQFYDLEHPF